MPESRPDLLDPIPLDPAAVLRSTPLFRGLGAQAEDALARELRPVRLPRGAPLFPEDDRIDSLWFLLSGRLAVCEEAPGGGETLVRTILPGEAVDQLQALSGSPRRARVRVEEDAELAVAPGEAVDRLVDAFPELRAARARLHRRELLCRLHSVLGPLTDEALADLETAADWVHLQRGELLYERDDPADAIHFVVSGRVQTVLHGDDGGERVLSEAGRGDVVGEAEFFTGARRPVRVRAVRDSVLVELTHDEFEAFIACHPHVLRHVTRSAVERMNRPPLGGPASGRVATVAVVAATPEAPVSDFCARLAAQLALFGPVLRLDAAEVEARMAEPGIAGAWEESAESERLLAWLEAREAEHRFVLYEAEPTASPWTRRCLRQADRILLVAEAGADPAPGPLERGLLLLEGRVSDAHEMLVLVHPDGTCPPQGTRRWLEARPRVEEHHHVRRTEEGDFARLARLLAGRAIGLVLGGGGARGFAHVGVFRALRDAGVPVDMVGGTSMGAALAAQFALGGSPEEIEALNRRVWVEIRPHRVLTVPVVSLVGSRKAQECGRMMYGETEIEDLWIPFFCVSSNLTTAEMVVHRSGSLLRAATASASLPAFAEPVVEGGQLLVDGGLLDNLPTATMRELGAGVVIACEVSAEDDGTFTVDRIPSPWDVLRGRARFPSLGEVLMRAILLHSTARQRSAIDDADLCLRPPVDAFGLMEFDRLAELVEVGRAHAAEALAGWTDRPPGVPPP